VTAHELTHFGTTISLIRRSSWARLGARNEVCILFATFPYTTTNAFAEMGGHPEISRPAVIETLTRATPSLRRDGPH
jgi:creatinine amidohydrolase/Fe(II)-dependent formamide hydrolase-like protein